MRREPTDAERRVWAALRDRRLAGHKFRRQVPIGPYVVDFLCLAHKLIIEVDGGQHATNRRHDARRTAYLEKLGFAVIRFWNNDALNNTDGIKQIILNTLTQKRPSPVPRMRSGHPLPMGEGKLGSAQSPLPWGEGGARKRAGEGEIANREKRK